MKKTKLFGWALFASMISLSACTNDTELLTQGNEIKLISEITPSRVTSLDYQSTQIVAGQKVGVTITGAKIDHNNVAWEVEDNGALTNTGDAVYYGNGTATITAYHPYNSAWTGTNHEFSVSTDQSTNAEYLASDLLWATATSSKTENPVPLTFSHKLAKINVTLTSTDIADLSGATISICGTNIATNFNPATGELSAATTANVQEIKAGVTTENAFTSSAIVVPQTIISGTKFIKVSHNNKVFYYTLSADKELKSGCSLNYTLTVKEKEIELKLKSENIIDWNDEDTIGDAEENDVAISIEVETAGALKDLLPTDYLTVTSLKVKGNLNSTDIGFIRKLSNLEALDLSCANIVTGGDPFYTNKWGKECSTKNNVFPGYFMTEANLQNLEFIALPNSVTEIEYSAFVEIFNPNGETPKSTFKLNNIILGENLETIGEMPFGCSIKTIHIPKNVKRISTAAFGYCPDLESITVDENNIKFRSIDGVLYEEYNRVWIDGKGYIDGYNLNVCPPNKKTFDFTNDLYISSIGSRSFSDCRHLTSIVIPETVEELSTAVFARCTSLKSVTIPASVVYFNHDTNFWFSNSAMEELHLKHEAPPSWYFRTSSTDNNGYLPKTCKLHVPYTDGWKYSSTNRDNWSRNFSIQYVYE